MSANHQPQQLPAHPIADLLPYHPEVVDQIAEDMSRHGYRQEHPLLIIPHIEDGAEAPTPHILDGRHRAAAAARVGISPRIAYYTGPANEKTLLEYALGANAHRRDALSPSIRAAIAAEWRADRQARRGPAPEQIEGEQPIPGAEPPAPEPQTQEQTATSFAISRTLLSQAEKLRDTAPDLYQRVRDGDITVKQANHYRRREQAEHARQERDARRRDADPIPPEIENHPDRLEDLRPRMIITDLSENTGPGASPAPEAGIPDEARLFQADIADLAAAPNAYGIEDRTVQIICTDPQYQRSHLDTWEDLARFAARTLQEGGTLAAMSGIAYLPQVFERLEAGAAGTALRYAWTIAEAPFSANRPIWPPRVANGWRPIIVYTQGTRTGPMYIDRIAPRPANPNDTAWIRRHHKWGQDQHAFTQLLLRLGIEPGDLVVDPFVGGGTTAIAAHYIKARFIGSDIDPIAVETTRRRLEQLPPTGPRTEDRRR